MGDDGATTSAETTASPTTAAGSVDSTTGLDGDPDAELCVQWCLNAEARGCVAGFHDEACYTRCISSLAPMGDCDAEYRAVRECESQAGPPAEPTCESRECEDVYKRHDLCLGTCYHLGGSPGESASPDTCEWRSTCYEHEFEVACPTGDAAAQCTCTVDGEVVSECAVGVALVPFECSSQIQGIFTSCCAETFAGVLLP